MALNIISQMASEVVIGHRSVGNCDGAHCIVRETGAFGEQFDMAKLGSRTFVEGTNDIARYRTKH